MGQPGPAVPGEFGLHKWRDGSNNTGLRLRAELIAANGDAALPVLVDALVLKVTASGIVVTGTEVVSRTASAKSNVEYYRQVWWCKVLAGQLKPEPAVAKRPNWSRSMEHPA